MVAPEDSTRSTGSKLQSWSRRSHRSFDIAARSLFESELVSGNFATVATVVAQGALHHHWKGLTQFALVRVGAEAARGALEEFRAWSDQHLLPAAERDRTRRPAALLYRRLRTLIETLPQRRLAPDAPEWLVPAEERLASAVLRLRRALSPEEAEAIELCHHRGLDPTECAFVLDLPALEIERRLAAGLVTTGRVISARDKRLGITSERLWLVAFSLDPAHVQGPARPPRKPVLEVGSVIQQRYEIEAPLGAGAFADVYRARDRDVTGHVVALKILRRPAADPQAVKSALRELQLIASVFHPSVVQLKDHGWYDGHLWFVMPLYRGETLARRLERGPLSRREAREIFEMLAEALATMHRVGVRHQDIKPENVFLANIGPEGWESSRILPVLLDLGVAAKDVELVLAGTPAYFAPEVAARYSGIPDPPAVGPQADVFSLALTLRDALDPAPRDPALAGAVDAFVSYRARHSPEPPRSPDLRDLKPWFERWLNRNPDARPSAEEFRRQLASLTRPAEVRQRRVSLLRWALPTALATLTVFASVVLALTRQASLRRSEAEEERIRAAQAFQRIETMSASLEVQEAARRQLEAEVTKLEGEYQNSRFTRQELATRLASTEGEAKMLEARHARQVAMLRKENEELKDLEDRYQTTLTSLESLRDRRDELAKELDRTKVNLEQERELRTQAEATSSLLGARLEATQRAIQETRARMAEAARLIRESESPPAKAAARTLEAPPPVVLQEP